MKPECSLTNIHVPATYPYPETDQCSPYSSNPLLEDSSWFYLLIQAWVLQVVSFLQVSPPKPSMHLSYPPYVLHGPPMPFFSISSEYRSLSYSLRSFPPLPCYLVLHRPKYSPQHPVLKHSQPKFPPQCERLSFTPIQKNRQNHSSAYVYTFEQQTGRPKIMHQITASIPWLQSALN